MKKYLSESMKRSKTLTKIAQSYLNYKHQYIKTDYSFNKEKIISYFCATEDDWNNWQWQMSHRINDAGILKDLFAVDNKKIYDILSVEDIYRWSLTPYYLSLINHFDSSDPVYLQAIPSCMELTDSGFIDPMNERQSNPAGNIVRRYPDRLIINVTNCCASFCRHCQRKRNFGNNDIGISTEDLDLSINYIKNHPEIRDVLITGGDPLTFHTEQLEVILRKVKSVDHVEIIRIGTRTLVTMPQRITKHLVGMLKNYAPIFINTHFNHPNELTAESKTACRMLADNGIILGNQMVFLKNVNNDYRIVTMLNQLLLKNRIRPYYIFHPKEIKGTEHFYISIREGLSIYEKLRGYTSGLAIPTYVYNAPGGAGKIALNPDILNWGIDGYVTLKNWEGNSIQVYID